MEYNKGTSELPTGHGTKLNNKRENLPVVPVKNEVLWVNTNLDTPFSLEVGKPTDLGLFFTSNIENESTVKNLEVESLHNRTALLGRVVFGEKTKGPSRQLFRDIDIKGLGYLKYFQDDKDPKINKFVVEKIQPKHISRGQSFGISTLDRANKDKEFSEVFNNLGIRTYRIVSIIALKEIVYDGETILVSKAKEMGLIAQDSEPVLEIRAFGTHFRLIDAFTDLKTDERKEDLIEDARLLVAQELGVDSKNFTRFDYFKWLAGIIGKNLALMHKNGYIHSYLWQGHNITLDGSLVDFESSVGNVTLKDAFNLEDTETFQALRKFFYATELKYPINRDVFESVLDEYKIAYDKYIQS